MPDTRFQINAPTVVAEVVDGEVIAINLSTGAYYSMRGWSAWAWNRLAAGGGVGAVQAQVPDPAEVDAFVAFLVAERLLVPAAGDGDGSEPGATAADVPTEAFSGLEAERFTDMEDLILLDPVHDVDPGEGWPRVAEPR